VSSLSFRTRNNVSPTGKAKVYFCCHPDDFQQLFLPISDEILAKQSCAVWYPTDRDGDYDELFFDDLAQMQLFVMPVTSRLLTTENRALDTEFRFAAEHHIPVLPLMQEKGLEALFNERCGELQFLDKYANDATAISYDEKLKKYLSSVLLSDETVEKIRNAFDAYVFLSYRKKDRRYANELMRLIHKNDFCRDIAIWYDEFLTPGENFNRSIEEALHKSALFVLAVTPNLVNEVNYIMTTEYPMALQAGKPVLPVEMTPTDGELLRTHYENIPRPTDAHNDAQLSEALLDAVKHIAMRESASSPEHLFFIGLAYLDGIDVEVDRERALSLITAAAESGLIEAIEKLVNMYTNGDGVKANFDRTVFWRKRLIEETDKALAERPCWAHADASMTARFELGALYQSALRHEEAIRTMLELIDALPVLTSHIALSETQEADYRRMESLSYGVLGEIEQLRGNYDTAESYVHRSLDITEELLNSWDFEWFRRDAAVAYRNLAQICSVRGGQEEAIEYLEHSLKLEEPLLADFDDTLFHLDVALTLETLSRTLRLISQYERSITCTRRAIDIVNHLIEIEGDRSFLTWKMSFLLSLEEDYRMSGDYESALKVLDIFPSLQERYVELFDKPLYYYVYARWVKLTQIHFQLARNDDVIRYGKLALKTEKDHHVMNDELVHTGESSLPVVHYLLASVYLSQGRDEEALYHSEQCVALSEQYFAMGSVVNVPDFIGYFCFRADLLISLDQTDEAEALLRRAASLQEQYHADISNIRELASHYAVHGSLGKLYASIGKYEEAIYETTKALKLFPQVMEQIPGDDSLLRSDLMMLYDIMSIAYMELDVDKAREYCREIVDLVEEIPEDDREFSDWDALGMACLRLYAMASFIGGRKWERKMNAVADELEDRFPEQCQNSVFLAALAEEDEE